jgi:hypothetical protein
MPRLRYVTKKEVLAYLKSLQPTGEPFPPITRYVLRKILTIIMRLGPAKYKMPESKEKE